MYIYAQNPCNVNCKLMNFGNGSSLLCTAVGMPCSNRGKEMHKPSTFANMRVR